MGLCITRRTEADQDEIYVDEKLKITVIRIKGNEVRLLFETVKGPDAVIRRGELDLWKFQQIQTMKKQP